MSQERSEGQEDGDAGYIKRAAEAPPGDPWVRSPLDRSLGRAVLRLEERIAKLESGSGPVERPVVARYQGWIGLLEDSTYTLELRKPDHWPCIPVTVLTHERGPDDPDGVLPDPFGKP